jgi:hypothetical protein
MNQNFHIYGLTTEYAVNPIDLFTPKPRFSWKFGAYPGFRQKAYRIAVASSREKAERGAYDLWDSGFVAGSRNVAVEYGGRELGSRQEGFWKCFAEDERGECAESEIASFEIALLSPEDWKGSWQSAPHHFPGCAQYWRCPFVLPEKKIRRARAYVCGLGYHELYLNGAKIGQSVLNPGVTDYSKRVLYCTYDITESLQAGENCIGFILGYGWFGARKLIAQVYIDFADGTETELHTFHHAGLWRVGRGPVLENSVYGGEVYDARLERETEGWCTYPFHADYDNGWVFSICTDAPAGKLVSQTFEPIEPVADCKGNLVLQEEGRRIYDFSANIAGWVKIVVRGERGAKVTVRHAEILNPGGTELETVNLRTAKATDVYILKGDETEEYEPHFTYHGFRYAELSVEGKAEVLSVTGRFVRTAVKAVSSFSCSDDVINRLHRNAVATEGANIHSILTDCPQRDERFGWLNDITSRVFQEVYNFDMARLYPKIMRDIADTQRPDGAISDTAPIGIGQTPADPISASLLLLGLFSNACYGDLRTLKENYPAMKAWVDFLGTKAENYLLSYSYYGDWVCPYPPEDRNTPENAKTPGHFMSAAYYYWQARLLSRAAESLGYAADRALYAELARKIRDAFNAHYFDAKTHNYGTGSQTCNSVALSVGLCEEKYRKAVAENTVKNIEEMGYHNTTGNQGYRHMFYALDDMGYGETLYRMLINPEYPGWGYMIACGATSVWERWESEAKIEMNSFNHPMFASFDGWFFRGLAGIRLAEGAVAADRILLSPRILDELTSVSAWVETVNGRVSSAWRKEGNQVIYEFSVPYNVLAEIRIEGKILNIRGLCETDGRTEKPSVFVRGGKIEITAEGAG